MSRFPEAAILAALFMGTAGGFASAQDAALGETSFAKCRACHAVGADAKNKVGPHLNGIVGRPAGSAEGFKYSTAMAAKGAEGLVWDEATLAPYLADPKGVVKGTKMAFAGIKKPEEISNLIAYLATFAEDGSKKSADAGGDVPLQQEAKVPPPAEVDGQAPIEPVPAVSGGGLKFGLGRLATEDEISAWDIDVRPDGKGLPPGRGTVATGMGIYDENCASCHGDFGEAVDRWPVLAGGQGTLQADRPQKTIGSYWPYLSTVYDYVRRAMPFGNARSLSNDDIYALTAYILYLNDVVDDEEFELSNENLASIRLPNEENFIEDDRASEPHNKPGLEPCMTDCRPGKAEITMHAAVLDVTPEDQENDDAPAAGID
jgi:cytochrome c